MGTGYHIEEVPRDEEFEKACTDFPDIPEEVILKVDTSRRGIQWTQGAADAFYADKTLDRYPAALFQWHQEDFIGPEQPPFAAIFNSGNCIGIRFTSPESQPYTIDIDEDGKFWVCSNSSRLQEIQFTKKGRHYDKKTSDGIRFLIQKMK